MTRRFRLRSTLAAAVLMLCVLGRIQSANACEVGEVECITLSGTCWASGSTCCGSVSVCAKGSSCLSDGMCIKDCPTGYNRCGKTHCTREGTICCADVGHEEISCAITHTCEGDGTCEPIDAGCTVQGPVSKPFAKPAALAFAAIALLIVLRRRTRSPVNPTERTTKSGA